MFSSAGIQAPGNISKLAILGNSASGLKYDTVKYRSGCIYELSTVLDSSFVTLVTKLELFTLVANNISCWAACLD